MKIKTEKLFWFAIVTLFLITRLINLKIIPIFTDEAIYTFWAQVALHDPENRFISLVDGKQPLFIWIAAVFQNFISDPLIATRSVSILAGFGSVIGIYILASELLSTKIARLSSFLYIILPLTLLYDRLALFDSLLTMFGIYAILLTVKMARAPKLDFAIINGAIIGAALITKSSGFFFLYLLPVSVLLVPVKSIGINKKFIKFISLSLLTAIISLFIYNLLRLSPFFYIIGQKNLSFIRTFQEVLASPFEYFISNINALTGWIINYLSHPLTVFLILGILLAVKSKNLKIIYLSILSFAPFSAEVIFNKVLYPRFILFYFPFLIIIIAYSFFELNKFFNKYSKAVSVIFLISLIIPAITSYNLLFNPTSANIPKNDSDQLLNEWPAGYGVDEIVNYLKQQSENEQIYIGTEGTFGLYPYALNVYFFGNSNVKILDFWPVNQDELPVQILIASEKNKTFFIFNANQKNITNPRLKLISKHQKGIGNSYMRLYEVIPTDEN